jgi:hypothetical protein
MELQYVKALENYGLKESDLSEDAMFGVQQIKDVIKMMTLAEKQGKVITERTFKKLRTLDKWTYYEILDQVNDTDNNEEEAPVSGKEIVEEIKNEVENQPQATDTKGLEIDAELEAMYKSGKSEWTLAEIKSSAKKTWNVIWDNYDENGDNGVQTSNYSLIESDIEVFTLKQK